MMNPHFSSFVATILESNRQGRDGWTRYAPHRARVTATLAGCARGGSSLCILGAGNLNDVDLNLLLSQFAEVHLVDLDVDAVKSALLRRGHEHYPVAWVHGPIDLTGILNRLPTRRNEDTAHVLADLLDALQYRCELSGGPFDVTASTGVLTQLLQSVVDSDLASADIIRVCIALRDKHLRDLVHLTRPGGSFVLISDVVSTATAPQLLETSGDRLKEELASLVAARNFFTGTNPYRILSLLEGEPDFRSHITDLRIVEPWLWAVTTDRRHLTYAIVARLAPRVTSRDNVS